MEEVVRELCTVASGPVLENVDLRTLGRWRIGGSARVVVEPVDVVDACAVLASSGATGVPVVVIGDGSNLLFDDAGFHGIVVRVGPAMARYKVSQQTATAEAGVWVPRFVRALGRAGLAGAQHAIGIPGTLGGLVMMNGGSQRKGIGDNVVRVRGCDMRGQPFELTGEECAFRYRGSLLQDRNLIVLEAELAFALANPAVLRREMVAIMQSRRAKFPKNLPNCGSVFLSDPAMYATVGPPGRAIELAGLKGQRRGNAQISPLHANFIVNLGGARSADVLRLVHLARTNVHRRTGFWMDCEVRHVAPTGSVRPAHIAAAEICGGAEA